MPAPVAEEAPPAPSAVPAVAVRADGTVDLWAKDLWVRRAADGRLLEIAPRVDVGLPPAPAIVRGGVATIEGGCSRRLRRFRMVGICGPSSGLRPPSPRGRGEGTS